MREKEKLLFREEQSENQINYRLIFIFQYFLPFGILI